MIDWVLSFGGHVFFIIGILLRRAPTRRIEAGASISSRWHSRSVPRRRSIEWKEREPWKERAANIDISEALSICSEQFHRSTHMPFSSYAEADPPLHRLPSRRQQERSKEGHQARGSDPVSRRPRRKGGGRKDPAKDRCHLGQGQGGRVRHVGNNDVYFRRRRRFDGGRSH